MVASNHTLSQLKASLSRRLPQKGVSKDRSIAPLHPCMGSSLSKHPMALSQVSEPLPLNAKHGINLPSHVTYVPPAIATHLPLPTPPETLAQPLDWH
jgi:hypothetical protein